MQQKHMIIIAIAAVVLLLVGGGAFFFMSSNHPQKVAQQADDQQEVIPTLAPDAIGMDLTSVRGGKAVTLQVAKVDGISSIDYEVTYTANNNNNTIPRGVIGHIDITPGNAVKQDVILGTCSDVCHYDTVVSPVKFTLKVAKTDGKIYQVEKSISL